jgi:hypothetical protein
LKSKRKKTLRDTDIEDKNKMKKEEIIKSTSKAQTVTEKDICY